ncbi:MAG: SIMPL domain-containing protein [Pseudomonadota bacterium]
MDSSRFNPGRGHWVLCLLLPIATLAIAEESTGIALSGVGEIAVEPDLARIRLQVTRDGRDVVALKREVDSVTADVLALARSVGLAAKDVTAAAMNVAPNRRYSSQKAVLDGVIVSRDLQLRVRDLDRLPELVNRTLKLGINGVNSIELDSSRREALEHEALALAIADARAETKRVAAGFEVRLGTVQRVDVDAHSATPRLARIAIESADAGQAFAPGEIVIRRRVQVRFAIEPGNG